jgi:enolase
MEETRMRQDLLIRQISARQIFSDRGHPGIEATVVAESGACGVAVATAGVSVGEHEVHFVYDGGERWDGRGVMKAVSNVNELIAPALKGMDATKQREIDGVLLELDGTPNKSRLGGNATASVSAATLKAGAASLGIPLYQHIGGVNACVLPTPGVLTVIGSTRYGGGQRSGGKPSYSFICFGFATFSDASYACWEVRKALLELLVSKYSLNFSGSAYNRMLIPAGVVEHDQQLWDLMKQAIDKSGNRGRIGIQVDVAAGTYYDKQKDVFVGLFSREDKTRQTLISLYRDMVGNYPFVILEDPLDEEDYEGHALLARELGIEVVGDDLFTTNIERLKHGISVGACNAILLKVNQIGTITEAFDVVQYAYRYGYGVMPCSSRGEGADIADYAVGLNTGHVRESGLDPAANRLLQIELELGSRAKFLGKEGFKPHSGAS